MNALITAGDGTAVFLYNLSLACSTLGTVFGDRVIGDTGTFPTVSVNSNLKLAANETVSVTFTAYNGTKTIDVYGDGSIKLSYFSAVFIC